ncbi:unnamed protein product [Somion occarium]|uniref:RanBD1 domain-containing protein n=1 Tax=Somion occarium TaxID=3059160 RepID=A0ABP1E3K6_9APHY
MEPEQRHNEEEGGQSPRSGTPPSTGSQGSVEVNTRSRPMTPTESAGGESSELKTSRKREREVSLEAGTPQATSSDADPATESRDKDRDRLKPVKKYRTNTSTALGVTQEEDDIAFADPDSGGSATHTPSSSLPRGVRTPPKRRRSSEKGHSRPAQQRRQSQSQGDTTISDPADAAAVSSSPPIETKVKMISRGVEDISWKGVQGHPSSTDGGDVVLSEAQQQTPPGSEDGGHEQMDHEPTPAISERELEDDKSVEEALVEQGFTISVPLGPNPPEVEDISAGEDEHSGEADPAEIPSEGQPERRSATPPPSNDEPAASAESKDAKDVENQPQSQITPPTLPSPPRSTSSASSVEPTSRKPSPPPVTARKRSPPLAEETPGEVHMAGMKRKLGDRTVSDRHVPEQEEVDRKAKRRTPTPPLEKDEELEEKKEKRGKKETNTQVKEPPAPKLSGFAAYASTSSPFAAVKGRNIFSSSSSNVPSSSTKSPWSSHAASSPSPFNANRFPSDSVSSSTAASRFSTPPLTAPTPSSPGQKRSGFEAFASSTSPFATAAKRPKSPPPFGSVAVSSTVSAFSSTTHGHLGLGGLRSKSPMRSHSPARTTTTSTAFSAYAGKGAFGSVFGSASAASSTSVLGGDGSASGSGEEDESRSRSVLGAGAGNAVSFGERLRAGKDTEEDEEGGGMNGFEAVPKVELTEQEVYTGEEEEDTIYQVRGKLFALSPQNQWKEKGTGTIKLNIKREDGTGARLVMRKEAVYTVLLNATLFKGMKCFLAQDPRYLRFSVFENGATTHYNLRVSNAKIAEELLEEINSHIPSD